MKLGEFIKSFSHNNIIHLHYRVKGGHQSVIREGNSTSMDWEVNKKKGPNRHYINNEVVGLLGIYECSDTINIVIERLENQPFIEEAKEDNSIKHESRLR